MFCVENQSKNHSEQEVELICLGHPNNCSFHGKWDKTSQTWSVGVADTRTKTNPRADPNFQRGTISKTEEILHKTNLHNYERSFFLSKKPQKGKKDIRQEKTTVLFAIPLVLQKIET